MKLHLLVLCCLIFVVVDCKQIMPWLCLERCGGTSKSIAQNLAEIRDHKKSLSAVSFEMYNLGANQTLVLNDLTRVHTYIKGLGLETVAMISSYPYPKEFFGWMKEVFANPMPFIQTCITEAKKQGFTTYNVDWEPTNKESVSAQDATDYANFLDIFAKEMHKHQLKVTVDIASWSPIWDPKKIGATAVDQVISMSTYTGTFTTWERHVETLVASVPLEKLSIGLMNDKNTHTGKPYTHDELIPVFDKLKQHNIQSISLWKMAIQDEWWPFLSEFGSDN
eukprot:TRINITY_DN795_c0_g2_i1.p1 TRINITY_DN795_c0_g2~~TRINITY_DN795_c0_g2_i1.p1  ORF type:complete len:311 (+),score=75.69 TRINITY_DN795_c0_g2_i1:99-935(+)